MIFDIPLSGMFPIAFFQLLVPLFVKMGLGATAASMASSAVIGSLLGGGIQAARGKDVGKGMLLGAGGGLFGPLLMGGSAPAVAGTTGGTAGTVAPVATGVGAGAPAAGTGAAAAKVGMGAAMKKGAASALGSAMVGQAIQSMRPDTTLVTPLGDQIGPPDFSAVEQLKQLAAQSQQRTPWWLTQVGGGNV